MAKNKTADQMASNWSQAMGSGTTQQRYKDGIAAFQGNPMALAATDDAQARFLQNVQNSVSSGKRKNALLAADPNTWRQNAINVGALQLSSGATKAKAKVQKHFQKWAPVYAQASQAAAALPKGGMANAIARVQASMSVLMAAAGRS